MAGRRGGADGKGRASTVVVVNGWGGLAEGEAAGIMGGTRGARADFFMACVLGNVEVARAVLAAEPEY